MPELTLKLGTITPLFMGSADPNIPELRAPSVKGMMRFWWRAANAHFTDLAKLKEEEALVFGDTKRRSRIMLEVNEIATSHIDKSVFSFKDHSGLKYLWYFLNAGGNKEKQAFLGKFRLRIYTRGNTVEEEQAFKQATGALWLAIHLGGMGNRSRRGSGAIKVLETDGDNSSLDFSLFAKEYSPSSFSLAINDAELLACNQTMNRSFVANYSHLHGASIFISSSSTNVYEALDRFGNLWSGYRGDRERVSKSDSRKFGHSANKYRQASPIFVTANGSDKSSRLCITILNNQYFKHRVYENFIEELKDEGYQEINHTLQTTP